MELVTLMVNVATDSMVGLRARITNVELGPIASNVETITFNLDDRPYTGRLVGRNRDFCVGLGDEEDKGIALRVMLDREAESV